MPTIANRFTIILLLLFIFASGIYYAATNSITTDESTHITTGYIYLHLNDYRFNIEHPPLVKQLAGLGLLFLKLNFPFDIYHNSFKPEDICKMQDAFLFSLKNDLNLILLLSRIPNILITVLLGIFIYLYSRKLNGPSAGMLSLALFALSPSFLGHSSLVTLDTTVSAFCFITIYFLMRFIYTQKNIFLVLTGIFLGLSLISKFSALVFVPIMYLLIFIYAAINNKEMRYGALRNFLFLLPLIPLVMSYKSSFKLFAPPLLILLFLSFFFKKNIYSEKIRYACAVLLIILTISFAIIIIDYTNYSWFPLHSATKAYFKGFSSFEGHARSGQGVSYLLGNYSNKGWWYYFPAVMIFKEPLEAMIILLVGLAAFFRKKEDAMSKLLLLLPLSIYLFAAMFINRVNIGVRHILPAYPFAYVIAGYAVMPAKRFRSIAYGLSILLILLALDVLTAYPAHISYFNRAAGGIDNGYKYLGDSNIAWGQDLRRLKKYIDKHNIREISIKATFCGPIKCAYWNIPSRKMTEKENIIPENRIYVIESTELSTGEIKWLGRIKPTLRIGGSLWIYDLTGKDREFLKTISSN